MVGSWAGNHEKIRLNWAFKAIKQENYVCCPGHDESRSKLFPSFVELLRAKVFSFIMPMIISFLYLLLHSRAVLFNDFLLRSPKKALLSTCFHIVLMLAICSLWQVSLCFGQTILPLDGSWPWPWQGRGTIWPLRFLPIHIILWFYELSSYKECLRMKMSSLNLFVPYFLTWGVVPWQRHTSRVHQDCALPSCQLLKVDKQCRCANS